MVRVPSDLENLEKMSRNSNARRKSQGNVMEFLKNKKVREFCCVKFIFSQPEYPNFEIFLGKPGFLLEKNLRGEQKTTDHWF